MKEEEVVLELGDEVEKGEKKKWNIYNSRKETIARLRKIKREKKDGSKEKICDADSTETVKIMKKKKKYPKKREGRGERKGW